MGDTVVCVGAIAAPLLLGGALWRLSRGAWRDGAHGPATPQGSRLLRGLRLVGTNALVLAFLLSVLFLPLETYYRLIADRSDALNLTRVSDRWFHRHYRFNNVGIRDDVDYHLTIAPGERRLTFLGDSVTVGHGIANVEDRFGNRVRREMGATWDVQILAANGLETGDELERLRGLVGAGYELDVVALAYSPNDISDLLPEWYGVLQRLYDERRKEPVVIRASLLADTCYWHLKALLDPGFRKYHEVLRNGYASEAWDIQQRRLLEIRELCRFRNASLTVFTFPLLELLGPAYPFRDVHARLDRLWAEAGVPHLDLLEVFEGRAASDLVVNRWDSHPNEEAHRLVAEAMVDFIEERFLARTLHQGP